MAALQEKTRLYKELQLAVESGIKIPEFSDSENKYVQWREDDLREIHDKYLNPAHVEPPTSEDEEDLDIDSVLDIVQNTVVEAPPTTKTVNPALSHEAYEKAQTERETIGEPEQTYTDWVSEVVSNPEVQAAMAALATQTAALSTPPDPAATPVPDAPATLNQGQSRAPGGYAVPREQWAQFAPRDLARLLNVPFSDRAAERAGLTFNTHGLDDILRIDSRGMVWFRDEVAKPAIPKRRMIRKVKTVTSNVETIETRRPDGGLDETFEIAGDEKHEIEIKISMPTSQVGIYVDPRMPFKIHQYGGRRAFDYEEVVKYWGGSSDMLPSSIKKIYIDIDLCFEIQSVRDTIEREYREKVLLGRSGM